MAKDGKVMLGHRIRRLRRELDLTQAQMAERLGLSPSYYNLIENNHRPVTARLLIKLSQAFDIEIHTFADTEESRLAGELTEVFADPLFREADIKRQDVREVAAVAPSLGEAVLELYHAYHEAHVAIRALSERVADRDKLQLLQTKAFPLEEVRDFFQANENHFPALEEAAEELWTKARLEAGELYRGLTEHLMQAHRIRVKRMPVDVMGHAIRRFDRHSHRLLLSELLSPQARVFHLAVQVGLLELEPLFRRIVETASLSTAEARGLARVGLANYFAGAVLLPYDTFIKAVRKHRYDIDLLQHRFDVTFEQIAHRLTTLQRPNARGVPFFMIRVDKAGNVSKRFSAAPLQFARFGGACPLWNVYDAFTMPGVLHTQLAEMPDGTLYFFMARSVTKPGGSHRAPPQRFALALGCEAHHAAQLVNADGLQLDNRDAAVPIGVNCRLCERLDCSQRAFPPLNHTLIVDQNLRGHSAFYFKPDPSP
ncbi:helix-turn-helix domain-containing protein [Caenispirillum bisanense]|uniref:Transcriptional regulator, XRE family n=1 Tax=Caenispirillum bisanense TaxID=414052 RepID=A0A286GAW2_9PROT|nr:short-chain fatty acyl-CoA regulator family protein [Caenispirillum bisanense]SOD92632.1 transcriptional regulator, XRE family [Caenispirillum bisanense]